MERIRIVGVVIFILWSFQAQCLDFQCSSTNDIDAALDEHLFDGPGWVRYSRVLSRIRYSLSLEARTNNVDVLKRHVFRKVLDLTVTTNMFRASGHLLDKAEYVDGVSDWAGVALEESDIVGMLATVTGVVKVATNDLEAAFVAARERDRALGRDERKTGFCSWNRPPNIRAWLKERDRRNDWNASVDKYRRKMVSACIRRLNVLWKDMDAEERLRRIAHLLESYGLSSTEDEF